MWKHKSSAKCWRERLAREGRAQDVHKLMDDNWDDVVIEIIARYPDKIKGNEADELFMNEREIEAIAFYDSFHNGLNMDKGGNSHTTKWKENMRQTMMGNNNNAKLRKTITATMGDKTWNFESAYKASSELERELGVKYVRSEIARAAHGKYPRRNPNRGHVYKGIYFKYD